MEETYQSRDILIRFLFSPQVFALSDSDSEDDLSLPKVQRKKKKKKKSAKEDEDEDDFRSDLEDTE